MPSRSRVHDCHVDTCLELIAGKWKSLILWKLSQYPVMRFGELQKAIPHITKKMLTQQLRQLEQDRLVDREVYKQVPPKVEYSLSEFGETLRPVLEHIAQWGETHEPFIRTMLSAQESEEL